MPQAYNDDEALDAFATRLERFKHNVDDERARLSSALARLGDSWIDREHDRFVDHFQATMHSLQQFWDAIDQAVPQLREDAEGIRRYHRLTPP